MRIERYDKSEFTNDGLQPVQRRHKEIYELMHNRGLFDFGDVVVSNHVNLSKRCRPRATPASPSFLPTMFRNSPTAPYEEIPIWIANKVFLIRDYAGLQLFTRFLDSLPAGIGRASVRHLSYCAPEVLYLLYPHTYPTRGPMPYNPGIQLATTCPGLRSIRLDLPGKSLVHWPEDEYGRPIDVPDSFIAEPRTVEEIVERYKLQQLFECKSLESVMVITPLHRDVMDHTRNDSAEQAGRDLVRWIKEEFNRRGQDVWTIWTG